MSLDQRPDSQLLLDARTDIESFGVFYDRRIRELLGFFIRRGVGSDIAFDLAGETFAAMLEQLDQFCPKRGPARAWMYGIARNKLYAALRDGAVEDRTRRALAMAPVALDADDLRLLEELALSPALELLGTCRRSSARRSGRASSTSATTRTSRARCAARRASCASA